MFVATLLFFSACEKEVSVSPPTTPVPIGKLFVDSNPRGAKIYEDGRNSGKVTPDSLSWLEEKEYSITLKMELLRDTTFKVSIKEDEVKSVLIDYTLNPKMMGKIKFSTLPDSAEIYLDGEFIGKTPKEIDKVFPGEYKVNYIRDNCRADSLEVIVSSNRTIDAFVDLVDTTYWVDYNTASSGAPVDEYTSIAIDQNGVVWLGSSSGLVSFDGKNWNYYNSLNSGLSYDYVNSVLVDNDNKVWVATPGGLFSFNGNTWKLFTSTNKARLPSSWITDLAIAEDGSILAATKKGIGQSQSTSARWKSYYFDVAADNPYISESWITGIDVDDKGDWWVTRYGTGLLRYNGIRWQFYYARPTDNDPEVYYRCVGHSANTVWFGHLIFENFNSVVGLSSFKNELFTRHLYGAFNGVPVYHIIADKVNNLWVSSDEGLYVFLNSNYFNRVVYRMSNTEMVTNKIRGVAFDNNDNAWIITNANGLYKLKNIYGK
jgi:ligand-binding sensor domain-containing protein